MPLRHIKFSTIAVDKFSTLSTYLRIARQFSTFSVDKFSTLSTYLLFTGDLSTFSVDKFSTLSTLPLPIRSCPQFRWISFPHFPHSNQPTVCLSTFSVDKFST